MSWSDHAANVAKSFASKLSLLRLMRFLPRKPLEDFYTRLIMPSVTYGLTVCKGWTNCGLPWGTSAEEVVTRTGWDSLETMYKLRLTEFFFKCIKDYLRNFFYRGIEAAEEMKTSFFQDQKWIFSENPYAIENQSHGTVSRTRKPGLKPWKNLNAVLQNFILIKWISNLF